MTDFEEIIKTNFEPNSDVLDEDGNVRQGVEVVDMTSGDRLYSNLPVTEEDYKTEIERKWDKLDENERERITRGDYVELKNCLKNRTRHTLLAHLRKQDRRRIVLLREHLIEICAYNSGLVREQQSGWMDIFEIVLICTRLMNGDVDTDEKLADDILIDDILSDSDEDD